ncbi:pyroglutamyl peptidase [Streptomyces sp. NPDC088745]|uniref:pyroglutamyl peptidase n=1 Tax=Streptomyces sp. NPDC088745 TaxID=3365884 RepID=UPI003811D534
MHRGPARTSAPALLTASVLALSACAGSSGTAAPPVTVASPAVASAPATAPVLTADSPTAEERRLDGKVPQELLRRSGFHAVAPDFARELGGSEGYESAERAVVRHGTALWRRAVDRAQGRGAAGGDLPRDDDRPLYWARLAMARELRAWKPDFTLPSDEQARLLDRLERTSRGHEAQPVISPGVDHVVLTGFDPFSLDREIRTSNPSGAAALALDGTEITTPDGRRARVEAVLFPVRWDDFAAGEVERALRTRLPRASLFATVSQGGSDRFDVERFNGARRGGTPDNLTVGRQGLAPVDDPGAQPQWTETSLPYETLAAARTGRFPVRVNTAVVEAPAKDGGDPVRRTNGPAPGSRAWSGSGGDYLSNEIAYRATLLRDRLGLSIPGGHLHTPVLEFGPRNATAVTDPVFLRNRADIVRQVRELLRTALGTVTD